MANVRLTAPVRHDGEVREPDDVIPDLSEKAAARLVRLGVGYIDDDVLSDDDGPLKDDDAGIGRMSKSDLIALAAAEGVALAGKESKAELIALISAKRAASNDDALAGE